MTQHDIEDVYRLLNDRLPRLEGMLDDLRSQALPKRVADLEASVSAIMWWVIGTFTTLAAAIAAAFMSGAIG